MILRCVQVGEVKALRWWWWTIQITFVRWRWTICDDNEQVGGNEVAIGEPRKGPANDILVVEEFGEEQQPLEE